MSNTLSGMPDLLTSAVERYMDINQLRVLREAEASERGQLRIFAGRAACWHPV